MKATLGMCSEIAADVVGCSTSRAETLSALHLMRLFLIRHGETVDNVAQVYAGVRDSALTNHGVQQAQRLGQYLSTTGPRLTHLFSSDLQRAVKTAEAIRVSQNASGESQPSPKLVQLKILREQDFGFYEGKCFLARPADSGKTGREAHYESHKNDAGFQDIESKTAMGTRMDTFLDEHLLPLMQVDNGKPEKVVAVVSHGIILSMLWKRLLLRLAEKSVTLLPELLVNTHQLVLEHLGGWGNTGYLELEMKRKEDVSPPSTDGVLEPVGPLLNGHLGDPSQADKSTSAPRQPMEFSGRLEEELVEIRSSAEFNPDRSPRAPAAVVLATTSATESTAVLTPPNVTSTATASTSLAPSPLADWTTTIRVINGRQHLKGLKRTRGGVGSAQHDEAQKTIETFFKKRQTG